MANFAREQLLKYGWTEGKGLGKNENGITEPVKLATNKDNAGIGYDDTVPWWERLFNDAAKNVKVESNPEDGASLSVNNAAWNANGLCPIILKPPEKFSPLENMFANQKFIEAGKNTMMSIQENRAHAYGPDQKIHAHNSKTVHETTGHNFLGKLGRITEQDINFLNASNKSQLNVGPVGKNTMDTYRKTNVESDVNAEETEHAIDSIEDILQSEKKNNIVTTKRNRMTKKRYKDWILFDFVNKEARKPKNVEHIDEKKMGSYAIKFDNKIQKKKNSCCHSKQIQKVVDKLKGDALAHELNSAIQNLTTFGISKEVNTIKNKLITHLFK